MSRRVNCFRCQHFYITWDHNFPKGCQALDFKTRWFPADVVRQSSGMDCLYFKEKPKKIIERQVKSTRKGKKIYRGRSRK